MWGDRVNRVRKSVWLAGIASIVVAQPVWGDLPVSEESESRIAPEQPIAHIPQLREIEQSATTVDKWLSQVAQAAVIEVTEVRLNATDAGLEVILVTQDGQLPLPSPSTVGNALIADIPGAVLALPDGDEFLTTEPAEGFEVGIKAELFDSSLLATLAFFDITKQNVLTEDPSFPGLGISIATGEQRSRGVEFDLIGEFLPGWNIIASYAYTDAEVTEDNTIPEGNQLTGIPQNNVSFWTTYEIQTGNLQGLGFGVGFNFVGERQGDLANSFELDSYFLANDESRTIWQPHQRRNSWRAICSSRFNLGEFLDVCQNNFCSVHSLQFYSLPATLNLLEPIQRVKATVPRLIVKPFSMRQGKHRFVVSLSALLC
jgi:hypothetical protein